MSAFSVLKYKNYKIFILGQILSNTGNMMQFVAVSWLAYQLTDSVFLIGVVSFSKQISGFFTGFFSGIVADRYNRKLLLMLSLILISLFNFIMGGLALLELMTIPLLIFLQILSGIVKAFEMPARQSFVNDMITDKTLLSKAIALNSTVFNTARLIGPTVAGILIPLVGEASCFIIYGAMSLIVSGIFASLKVERQEKFKSKLHFVKDFQEGFNYAFTHQSIKTTLVYVGAFAFFGTSFIVLLPVLAGDIFKGDAQVFGYMNSAQGVGAIIAGILIAKKGNVVTMHRLILKASIIFCLGLLVVSYSNLLVITLIGIILTGFGRVSVFASSNTLLQLLSADKKRGRVLSLYITIFMGSMTLGGLSSGAIADYFGVMNAFLYQSLACVVITIVFAKNLHSYDTEEISSKQFINQD